MNISGFDKKTLLRMAHSPVKNYVVPGLTSSLIGGVSENGCVRLFESERDQQETITPHSHRFDFQCIVLSGTVINRIWTRKWEAGEGDWFSESIISYNGDIGSHLKKRVENHRCQWSYKDNSYKQGECYSMTSNQVHSIWFTKGRGVVF